MSQLREYHRLVRSASQQLLADSLNRKAAEEASRAHGTTAMPLPTAPSNTSPPASDCSPKAETNVQHGLITTALPLQQPIPSASPMPSSHKASHASPSITSTSLINPYTQQLNSFIANQRKLHDEERALWDLERTDLHTEIERLEAVVRRYRSHYGSTESSVSSTLQSQQRISSSSTLYSSVPPTRNISANSISIGDAEPWRGPEAGPAKRTFSDVSFTSTSTKAASLPTNEPRRLSSIDEDPTSRSSTDQQTHHKSSIDGAQIDPALDGIMFKPTVLNPPAITLLAAGVSNLSTDSPSPTTLSPTATSSRPTPLDLSPNTLSSPSRPSQPTPQITLNPDSFITKDAGHTPLPSKNLLDPIGGSPNSQSEQSTPLTADFMLPPRVPRGSIAPPILYRGRKGSRWPGAEGFDEDDDEDPSLTGPLGLLGDDGDHKFLSELNERLETAARSREASPSPLFSPMGGFRLEGPGEKREGSEGTKAVKSEVQADGLDQSEEEPRLKIKRSMNFGSQLGGKLD